MSDFAPQFLADLKTHILAVWTDIENEKDVLISSQALEFNLLQLMGSLVTRTDGSIIDPPLAIIEWGRFQLARNMGVAQSGLYYCPVAIWYLDMKRVRDSNISDYEFVQSKLYALKTRLQDYHSDSFSPVSAANMDCSHSCAVNVESRGQQYEIVGGVIWWDEGLLTGEHFTT